jgi:hypothetical protein
MNSARKVSAAFQRAPAKGGDGGHGRNWRRWRWRRVLLQLELLRF